MNRGGLFTSVNPYCEFSMSTATAAETVTATLQWYANRGIFRGFSPAGSTKSQTTYRMVWHRDHRFEFVADIAKKTLRIPVVLPEVPSDSDMYAAFKEYVKRRKDQSLPVHRKIDETKVEVKVFNRSSNISLTAKVLDGDFEYATKKLVHLVHEIYMDFLMDGRNYEYLVEKFNLDPDAL